MHNTALRETLKRSHGHIPLYIYHITAQKDHSLILTHWHNELEILYCTGEGKCLIDDVAIDFSKGDLIFFNPKSLHTAWSHNNNLFHVLLFDYNFLSTNYPGSIRPNLIDQLVSGKLCFPSKIPHDSPLSNQISPIVTELIDIDFQGNSSHLELKIKSNVYELLYLLSHNQLFVTGTNVTESQNYLGYVTKALDYIHNNYEHKITIADLAKHVSINHYYLIKIFKKATNSTPIDYIISYRLAKSLELLATDMSITMISDQVGFNQMSYYIRKFKNQYGFSPGYYRKHALMKT